MITKNRFFRKDSKEAIFLSLYPLLIYSFRILSQIVNHIFEGIYKVTELSYIRKLKELRKLRRMSCCLKNYVKKTIVLTPQRPQGVITPLTPLTSEFAKLELILNYIYIFFLKFRFPIPVFFFSQRISWKRGKRGLHWQHFLLLPSRMQYCN